FRRLLARLTESLARELEFAGNASHELRTPLTTIRLHAERAMQDAGAEGRGVLTVQLSEIDRMTRLIDSILVMAREAEAGVPWGEVVNLADLIRALVQRGQFAVDWGAAGPPDEVLVRGDESLLGIAVENLLDNARKFASAGSRTALVLEE